MVFDHHTYVVVSTTFPKRYTSSHVLLCFAMTPKSVNVDVTWPESAWACMLLCLQDRDGEGSRAGSTAPSMSSSPAISRSNSGADLIGALLENSYRQVIKGRAEFLCMCRT